MKSFRFALLLALGAAAIAAPASAWPYIDVTASEVLSVDPPRVRTTFDLSFVGYHPGGGPAFFITPLASQPALHLLECQAPASWYCQPSPQGDFLDFNFHPLGGPWPPSFTFSIVTDQAIPCVRFLFWDPLLGKVPSPSLNATYEIEACLLVDAPVPTRPASWGSMKSLYR